ncbi:MAG: MFS transporter [Promethearchaeota archaeon]
MLGQKKNVVASKSIESSEYKYKWSFKPIEQKDKRNFKKTNYFGFFLLYFALSVIRIYLIIYIPVFLLNILSINRGQLAFVQVFVYIVMFSSPILGYLFDRYTKKKRVIIFSFSILFLASFLLSVFGVRNLGIFGLFLAINLLSHEIVKVGVSKMILDHSGSESVKDGNLASINISSNVGSFIPSILFLFTVDDIFNLNQWNGFFFIGFLCSLPIIVSTVLLRETANNPVRSRSIEKGRSEKNSLGGKNHLNLILFFFSYLLIWSDKLYQFPFSSWILTQFGERGFNIYSLLYIVFILLNIGGWIVGQRLSSRENSKINNIFMAISDFLFLMIIQGVIQVIAGIMMLNYTSLMMTMANNGKYKTFTFQCLKIAYAFSCVIFLPLGTYLSAFIQIEILIMTVGFLAILSLIPLMFLRTKTRS